MRFQTILALQPPRQVSLVARRLGDCVAYFTLMASAAEAEVDALRQDPSRLLRPTLVSGASHLLSYWVQVQPLGQLLQDAVDGGELLHSELWHPLRPPMFHRPLMVRSLTEQVGAAWEIAKPDIPQDDGDWLVAEVGRLLRLYQHAAAAGECVVTALDLPGDEERASRVRIPWKPK
jgi:hypothetical protein